MDKVGIKRIYDWFYLESCHWLIFTTTEIVAKILKTAVNVGDLLMVEEKFNNLAMESCTKININIKDTGCVGEIEELGE